ncbi:hypothetical protein NQ317_018356 [Molorchus minor]|uniref:VASt domain-containing protein n=1 Tax=Molorchus minor TaxID=1323400 RepID=A0ABQ9JIY3_9CUCU|nr:hypothetical protein NQ317_018356 [Molorchus minor]
MLTYLDGKLNPFKMEGQWHLQQRKTALVIPRYRASMAKCSNGSTLPCPGDVAVGVGTKPRNLAVKKLCNYVGSPGPLFWVFYGNMTGLPDARQGRPLLVTVLVHQCYGSELGLTSDDEDYIAPVTEDEKLSARLSVDSFVEWFMFSDQYVLEVYKCFVLTMNVQYYVYYQHNLQDNIIGDGSAEHLNMDHKGIKGANPMKHKMNGSDSQVPTDVTDNSESDVEKPIKYYWLFRKNHFLPFPRENSFSLKTPTTPESDGGPFLENQKADINVRCTSSHEGRQLLNSSTNPYRPFYLDFHAARKTTDLTQTPWTHNPLDNSKSRVVNLTVALSQTMGPKTAQVTETQVMLPCSKAGSLYSIDVDTLNAGIPYADSFLCNNSLLSPEVYAQIRYRKSVWGVVKGMIERNAWAGLDDFFTHLIRGLSIEGEENIPDIKRKSRRKRRLHSIPRIGLQENNIRTEMYFSDVPHRKKIPGSGFLSADACTLIVFFILVLLLLLNVVLYYKLWSNPPKSQEEWVKLLQQQEALHTLEAHKWQRILKASIELLKQAEESLSELQRSIHPSYANKLMSILQNQQNGEESKEELWN